MDLIVAVASCDKGSAATMKQDRFAKTFKLAFCDKISLTGARHIAVHTIGYK